MNNLTIKTNEAKQFSGCATETILNSALTAGLVFEYSCKTGQCGICKVKVISGDVIELKSQLALSSEERIDKNILSCCCAPQTDILIEAEDLTALHEIDVKTLPCRIQEIKRITEDLIVITLRVPPNANFKFLEGQYLDIIGPNSIRRSYSIFNASSQKEVQLCIKRVDNGQMSDYWFNKAKENDLLRFEGPKGTFFLRENHKDLVFLATGTGIAPIHSILNALDSKPDYVQLGDINLYWGNRTPEQFFWQPRFKKLQIKVTFALSRGTAPWDHQKGYVQNIALKDGHDLSQTTVYACGSNAMIKSAQQDFIAAGLNDNNFYSDAFVQSY